LSENETTPLNGNERERRIESRLLINAQAEISGTDEAGNSFMAVSTVKNFSDVGCQLQTQMPLRCGSLVAIRLLGPDGQSSSQEPFRLFEIVWTRRRATEWMVGARVFRSDSASDAEESAK
jgi:hypothetical protein